MVVGSPGYETTTTTSTNTGTTTSTTATTTTTTLPWSSVEFYMYRAQAEETFPLENVNAADLRGVVWYLHNEVVHTCPWHYNIDRIRRVRVTMNTGFAPFVAFDNGQCTAPTCESIFQSDGYRIGCQPRTYPNGDRSNSGHWYALPGPCPGARYDAKTQAREKEIRAPCNRCSIMIRLAFFCAKRDL